MTDLKELANTQMDTDSETERKAPVAGIFSRWHRVKDRVRGIFAVDWDEIRKEQDGDFYPSGGCCCL